MTNKEKNLKEIEEIAERIGDTYLTEMFWSMFKDIPVSKQGYYIEWAKRIENNLK